MIDPVVKIILFRVKFRLASTQGSLMWMGWNWIKWRGAHTCQTNCQDDIEIEYDRLSWNIIGDVNMFSAFLLFIHMMDFTCKT